MFRFTKKLSLLGMGMLILTGCSNKLPGCNSKEAQDLISQIVADKSYAFGNFVDLKSVKEEAFNENTQIRTCKGKLVTTKDSDEIYYNISWKDQVEGIYWLEIN